MTDEWEEEVVFVSLSGLIDQQLSSTIGQNCKIVGIDSNEPILRLGGNVFNGSYSDALGSKVMFEVQTDETEAAANQLKYVCCTDKILNMQRVFLSKFEGSEHEDSDAVRSRTIEIKTGKSSCNVSRLVARAAAVVTVQTTESMDTSELTQSAAANSDR